jgi:hypothetical protein
VVGQGAALKVVAMKTRGKRALVLKLGFISGDLIKTIGDLHL